MKKDPTRLFLGINMAAFIVLQQGRGDVMRKQSKKEQTQPRIQGRVTVSKIFEEKALGARFLW